MCNWTRCFFCFLLSLLFTLASCCDDDDDDICCAMVVSNILCCSCVCVLIVWFTATLLVLLPLLQHKMSHKNGKFVPNESKICFKSEESPKKSTRWHTHVFIFGFVTGIIAVFFRERKKYVYCDNTRLVVFSCWC